MRVRDTNSISRPVVLYGVWEKEQLHRATRRQHTQGIAKSPLNEKGEVNTYRIVRRLRRLRRASESGVQKCRRAKNIFGWAMDRAIWRGTCRWWRVVWEFGLLAAPEVNEIVKHDEFPSNALLGENVCWVLHIASFSGLMFKLFVLVRLVVLKLGEAQFDRDHRERWRHLLYLWKPSWMRQILRGITGLLVHIKKK